MEEKERYVFGQRILYNNEKEVVCFDGFNLDEFMGIITNILNKQDKENHQLKQQLEEKEKEIEKVKKSKTYIMNFGSKVKEVQVVDDNQDKISFAVEQLEKVKDYFIEGYAVCKNFSDFYWNFTEQIDNQIKQLKGEE